MKLRPYPEYKDSGVPWLGEVPDHWKLLPLFAVASVKSITNLGHRELLSVYLELGVVKFTDVQEKRTNATSEDLSKYQAVDLGDLVLNNQQAWRGSVGVSRFIGIVSPAYLVLKLNKQLDTNFANRLFRDRHMVNQYLICSKGVGSIQRNLYWPQLKRILVSLPPYEEQTQIARFLDWKTAQIDRFIRAKRRLIERLKEQKQALINQAVTGRIDVRTGKPYPAYKDSGVPWLGKVPVGWNIQRLKHVAKVQTGLTLGKQYGSEPVVERPYLRVANVQEGHLLLDGIKTVFVPQREAKKCTLEEGDVLMTEGGDIDKLGRGCIWNNEIPGCLHQNHIFALRLDKNMLLPSFLELVMVSRSGRMYFEITAKQTTNLASTNSTTLGNFALCFPDTNKQQKIVNAVKKMGNDIEQYITRTQREIDLIQEYRTRLIADVVTGKLDVREVAVPEMEALEEEEQLATVWKPDPEPLAESVV